jgi:hypothetical protein
MLTVEQRLEALEADVAALKAPKSPLRQKPVEESKVTIVSGPAVTGMPDLAFPNEQEYRELREIVERCCPHLKFVAHNQRFADADEQEHIVGFQTAFMHLATLERLDTLPRADRYPSWWVSGAENWARAMGLRAAVPIRSFLAALGAHGDVLFSNNLDKFSTLALRQGDYGRRYCEAWREVLKTGKILQPVKTGSPAARLPDTRVSA